MIILSHRKECIILIQICWIQQPQVIITHIPFRVVSLILYDAYDKLNTLRYSCVNFLRLQRTQHINNEIYVRLIFGTGLTQSWLCVCMKNGKSVFTGDE